MAHLEFELGPIPQHYLTDFVANSARSDNTQLNQVHAHNLPQPRLSIPPRRSSASARSRSRASALRRSFLPSWCGVWGDDARWSSRAFAVVWPAVMLSAAFPFVLGVALALLALLALQRGRHLAFAIALGLTLGASPLAFLLLLIVLAARLARTSRRRAYRFDKPHAARPDGRRDRHARHSRWRLFPTAGRFPFSGEELAAASLFCLNRHGADVAGRPCTPSSLRVPRLLRRLPRHLRYALDRRRERGTASLHSDPHRNSHALAAPLAPAPNCASCARTRDVVERYASRIELHQGDQRSLRECRLLAAGSSALQRNLGDAYRVEAVDTVNHWEALYLPRRESRSRAGGSGRTTFRRTASSTERSVSGGTSRGSGGSGCVTSCSRMHRPTTAPAGRPSSCAAVGSHLTSCYEPRS